MEHGLGQRPGLRRVGRIVVVEPNVEAREIPQVLGVHAFDEALGRDPLGLGLQHDRGAVGVVGAHVVAGMPREALETDPDIGLDVLDQVSQVDGAVGVGQGAGDEDFAGGVAHGVSARRRVRAHKVPPSTRVMNRFVPYHGRAVRPGMPSAARARLGRYLFPMRSKRQRPPRLGAALRAAHEPLPSRRGGADAGDDRRRGPPGAA